MKELTTNTWIISDTHFGHDNIIKYANRPKNHDTIMFRNWLELVDTNDRILHLGDVTIWYGDKRKYWETTVKSLPGKKTLLMGNHDKRSPSFYRNYGFSSIVKPFKKVHKGIVYLFTHEHELHTDESSWTINIHGHSHTHKEYKWSPNHINVSIEHMDYKPVRLLDIIEGR